MKMDERKYVELIDEDGKAVAFEVIVDFEVDGQEYAVLAEKGAEDEAVLFRVIDDGQEEPSFEVVVDDIEFETVSRVYEELMNLED
jgi:uncharacterized protein YrzB (UPF0473 family)